MPKTKLNCDRPHRQKAFDAMTAATKRLAADLDQKLAREHHDGLLLRHDVGRALAQVMAGEATYGAAAVDQLAVYLAVSPDRLYKLRNYAQAFTHEEVAQWAERRTAAGGRIRYHHLTAIMAVKSPPDRLRLIERVFAESLSVRSLRAMIAAGGGEGCKDGKDGRPPKTLLHGLGQLIERSQAMVKKFRAWRTDVLDVIGAAEPATVDPLVRNKAVVARHVLDELAGQIEAAVERLAANTGRSGRAPVKAAR